MRAGDADSIVRSVHALNSMDIAVIQHEFGIFGGTDGNEVLALMRGLRVPSIVVLHTVVTRPTAHQKMVFIELCRRASAIVTMSMVARNQLVAGYPVDPRKVFIVPHGARDFSMRTKAANVAPPLILTWGLMGPGKGIEWAIEAMNLLRDLKPTPRYVIAGRTHPKVFERDHEAYREGLQRRINELNLTESVRLEADYLNNRALDELIASSSIVLLPYDSTEQVTSGVLIEAISARRPIVATRFPHAVELLSGNVGALVPHRDPVALAAALREIIEKPEVAAAMTRRTSAIASELLWSSVAAKYVQLGARLVRSMAIA
ncbi:D-inositol-3-phosphate glycosyltransferase [mine drainage metagenome]|uniref:D-inositol-3-phosphate glycosyltransferase n=1 Tax=mine drainage metagenome TaxID=410659 RepID=A0A1J5Q538_9ZZZZ